MGIVLYDTTLRDGAQREGISFSVDDKLKIAQRLDRLGVHYIEGGWPGSNPKDMAFFERLPELHLQQATVVAFGSTRRAGVSAATRAWMLASCSTATPARRVLPKATTMACCRSNSGSRSKKDMSLGLEPGQPPSI